MSILYDDDHDSNQPRFPCPCCKTDCGELNCIFCDECCNWFHQGCAKLSDKRFKLLGNSVNLNYKCKFCKSRTKKCSKCSKTLKNVSEKKLYCISCKEWSCHDCLTLTLSTNQILKFTSTDLPYFCTDCSIDYYCPVCTHLCRDKCIFCQNCEKFLHLKCTKLTRGQGRQHNFICNLCIRENLPVCAVTNPDSYDYNSPRGQVVDLSSLDRNTNSLTDVENQGCGLCTECDSECLTCDLCPDLQRVCSLCLSCKYYDPIELNTLLSSCSSDKTLFVTHMNARSLTTNFHKIENLLSTMTSLKPDVIGISETMLNEEYYANLIKLHGFSFICKHSVSENSDYGGVGMYIANEL